jgi:hypothetical protein
MQTRTHSLIESLTNVVVGYLVAVISQQIIFPLFGYPVSWRDSFAIGVWMTAISIIRTYALRRIFTKRTEQ